MCARHRHLSWYKDIEISSETWFTAQEALDASWYKDIEISRVWKTSERCPFSLFFVDGQVAEALDLRAPASLVSQLSLHPGNPGSDYL